MTDKINNHFSSTIQAEPYQPMQSNNRLNNDIEGQPMVIHAEPVPVRTYNHDDTMLARSLSSFISVRFFNQSRGIFCA